MINADINPSAKGFLLSNNPSKFSMPTIPTITGIRAMIDSSGTTKSKRVCFATFDTL
ncbi:MAG: hypothetical protein QXU32_02670 [Nitrososphaerales archaeon]